MYDDSTSELKNTSPFFIPFSIRQNKVKHENILKLLQDAYALKVSEKKAAIQAKLSYLRDRVKNSNHLSSENKLFHSDSLEVIAGTVFERNASLSDLEIALRALEMQDIQITKNIETLRKEFIFSEIVRYKTVCADLLNYFQAKQNQNGESLAQNCISSAEKLLGPRYIVSGADFIESLSRERVFSQVQKTTQAKQLLIQEEQYALLQKKKEEEKLIVVPPAPRQEGKVVVVNVGLQRLYAYENGKTIFPTAVTITTGKYGFETVYGEFAIYLKERMHQMRSPFPGIYYDDVVNYWMPFYLGYGLHDAPWRSVYGTQDYSVVGSHGCVNMPLNETIILYNWADVGTRVIVL
jgi:lipoprotein-anchoring transpeptidase ErfK/SrfK